MKNPWQKKSTRISYKNPYWEVRSDKVIQPDGRPGRYHFVQIRDFVSVFALDNDGKSAYLSRQWRYPTNRNSWECCEGLMDKGESPLKAAKRELAEEMGLKAEQWQKIGFCYPANGLTNQGFHIFIARKLAPVPLNLEGTEKDMITRKFSFKKIEALIKSGVIKDAPTITSFYHLKLLKKI